MPPAPRSALSLALAALLAVTAFWLLRPPAPIPVLPAPTTAATSAATPLSPLPASAPRTPNSRLPSPITRLPSPNSVLRPPSPALFGAQGPVTLADVPPGRFHDELLALAPPALARALASLAALRIPVNNVASLHAHPDGDLYFACARPPADSDSPDSSPPRLRSPLSDFPPAISAASTALPAVSVPASTPPLRHSKPGASRVFYLDFNGHTVTGTSWNTDAGAPSSYVCTAYDTDGNSGSFSPAEQAAILLIWERVADSFRAFDVDVTTEQPAVFNNQTSRALITKPRDASGVANPASATASGVAYLNAFGNSNFATATSICFVYTDGATPARIAAIASHELGHHMGLSHDGTATAEYYAGHGFGDTSWAPIMGSSARNIQQWSRGEYLNSNNPQDDLAIIAAKLTLRPGDLPSDDAAATPLAAAGSALSARGLIETTADTDTFSFTTSGGALALTIGPVISPDALSNTTALDVAAELRDATGALVLRADPPDTTAATLATTLAPGAYTLRVTGTGTGNPLANPPTGYTAYGSLGTYEITGTVPPPATPVAAAIATEPENQTAFPGNAATFALVARGQPAPAYAWQRSPDAGATWTDLAQNSTAIGTATSALTISALASSQNGERYRCLLTNAAGTATSTAATLTVLTAPPPTLPAFDRVAIAGTFGRAIPAGTSQNLTATLAAGSDPITYRWQRDGLDLPGANGNVYFTRQWNTAASGAYRLVATNAAGTATSPPFTQTVTPEGGWTRRNPLPTGNGLTSAAYVNGRFFIGGLRGTVLTSTDAANWSVLTLPAANNVFAFQYQRGLYVALASIGAVFTSADGLAWTPRDTGITVTDAGSGLQDLTLGAGRLVAVGINGITATSTDGLTWTPGTVGATEDLLGVAYAFGRFHAVSSVSGRIFSTADGVNWTSVKSPSSGMRRITFGAGRLVAIGAGVPVLTSADGLTWTPGTIPTTESLLGVNFINDRFIATGTAGVILTSPDGLAWTTRDSGGNSSNLQASAYGAGRYVIPGQAGTSGRALLVSTDGVSWRDTITGPGGVGITLRAVTAGPSALVAVGTAGTILASPDGTRWTAPASTSSAQLNDVHYAAGRFVAVGAAGTILVSADATAWTAQSAPATVTLNGVRHANGLWLIAASSGRIFTSPDATLWTQRYNGGPVVFQKVAYGAERFVAVGSAGALIVSNDGLAWTTANLATTETLNDVTYAAGRFVAVGTGGFVRTSTDGLTWTDRSFSADTLTSVTHANGSFLATGPGSTYYVSPDGATWTARFTGTNDALLDCAAFGDALYLVGDNSAILAAGAPAIASPSSPAAPASGAPLTLSATVAASAYPLAYQWFKDGLAIPGANGTSVTFAATAGLYTVAATGPLGTTGTIPALVTFEAPAPGRLINLSVRTAAGSGPQTLIVGFAVSGAGKPVLIRGIGPGLTPFGVTGALADPKLDLFNSAAASVATNDNWSAALATAFTAVGAFPLAPASQDAALATTLGTAGSFTAQLTGVGGTTGIALAELYDTDPTPAGAQTFAAVPRLINVSARAQVDTGGGILIAGFVISGNVPKTVLIRAIGPSLTQFAVAGALADPRLDLYRGDTLIQSNDNWSGAPALSAAFTSVGAFQLSPATSKDAALLVTLPPGSYTAQVSGVAATTGVALIEVYEVP